MCLMQLNEFGPRDAFPEDGIRGIPEVITFYLAEKWREGLQVMQPSHPRICVVPTRVNFT